MRLIAGPYIATLDLHTRHGEPVEGDIAVGKHGIALVCVSEHRCPGAIVIEFQYDSSGARWEDMDFDTDRYLRTSACTQFDIVGPRIVLVNPERESRFEFLIESKAGMR